mmetsp:Transcript_4132/g.10349  ORF Transcript_4132/g.10349 Transcript_4132/m.10349 type:complete len:270 (-) Transcript_4132:400-1209(-)
MGSCHLWSRHTFLGYGRHGYHGSSSCGGRSRDSGRSCCRSLRLALLLPRLPHLPQQHAVEAALDAASYQVEPVVSEHRGGEDADGVARHVEHARGQAHHARVAAPRVHQDLRHARPDGHDKHGAELQRGQHLVRAGRAEHPRAQRAKRERARRGDVHGQLVVRADEAHDEHVLQPARQHLAVRVERVALARVVRDHDCVAQQLRDVGEQRQPLRRPVLHHLDDLGQASEAGASKACPAQHHCCYLRRRQLRGHDRCCSRCCRGCHCRLR